ncbi:MAG: (d)CMP kinase, partial [Gammaproteobacteria bacterium]|nr:(d)CMP kinase [Gammaproteobacteria bacterium]
MNTELIPVITIDGPSGVGKGTISHLLSRELGWHFLDSGALYRLLALAAERHTIALQNTLALVTEAEKLDVSFPVDKQGNVHVVLENQEVSADIRTEQCATVASKVAAIPEVRQALLQRQRDFRQLPGLVADGRDMGSTVFTDAEVKIFLTATAEVRAERRYKQLKEKGLDVKLRSLVEEIEERDRRDRTRSVSPLKPA